jgi:predicted phage-related endonuclease
MSRPVKHVWPKKSSLYDWEILRGEMEGKGSSDIVRIGASDVSAAVGASTYKCPARLFHHLTGRYSSFFMTERTIAGHMLEPLIADRFMGYVHEDEQSTLFNWQNGVRLRKIKKAEFFLTNPEYPHLFVSLDYVPVGKVYSPFTGELYAPLTPFENKSTNERFYKNSWEPNNGIPYTYWIQLNTQMLVSNTKMSVFNVLIDGVEYKVQEYDRDDLLCEMIVTGTEKFADIVKIGKMAWEGMQAAKDEREYEDFAEIYDAVAPDPVGIEDDVSLERELFPEDNSLSKLANEEDERNMQDYLDANEIINQMKSLKDRSLAKLCRSLEDFEVLESDNYKFVSRRGPDRRPYTRISTKNK